MLKPRYKGFFSAAKQMYRKEGARSFYKGFTAFFLATSIWMFSVPSIAQWYMMNSPFANQDNRDITFKGDSSPSDRYEDEAEDIYDEDLRAAVTSQRNRK